MMTTRDRIVYTRGGVEYREVEVYDEDGYPCDMLYRYVRNVNTDGHRICDWESDNTSRATHAKARGKLEHAVKMGEFQALHDLEMRLRGVKIGHKARLSR